MTKTAANPQKKLWLDDRRTEPGGWVRTLTAPEAIALLSDGSFSEVSLDHDLGCCKQCLADNDECFIPSECVHTGNGYHVACWLEERVALDPTFNVPEIHVHTDNASARIKMMQAVLNIKRIVKRRTETE